MRTLSTHRSQKLSQNEGLNDFSCRGVSRSALILGGSRTAPTHLLLASAVLRPRSTCQEREKGTFVFSHRDVPFFSFSLSMGTRAARLLPILIDLKLISGTCLGPRSGIRRGDHAGGVLDRCDPHEVRSIGLLLSRTECLHRCPMKREGGHEGRRYLRFSGLLLAPAAGPFLGPSGVLDLGAQSEDESPRPECP